MSFRLLFHTLVHLRPTQMLYQVYYRLHIAKYVALESPTIGERPAGFTAPLARWNCWEQEQSRFRFLNISAPFSTWNETSHGMLWAYNQNYMDWLNQEGISKEDCCYWIDKFIEDVLHTENNGHTDSTENTEITNYQNNSYQVGLDPYPIALRSINWVKVLMRWPDCATKERMDSLYSQLRLLERKLEYHLLANHLLEDAYALYIGAVYFGDKRLMKKSKKLLLDQLKEQILADGAHYEQSVMYHCILLDRLLDCINISCHTDTTDLTDILSAYAERMLGHLESVIWEDGCIPMVNDAAYGIAPTPDLIFDYARRLGLKWEAKPMKECGYRKMKNQYMEAIVDVGNITASYQPGHTHADTFNYELRIKGISFIVDTGVSTYNKDKRRQYERSTAAHNTVCVNNQNSSEVWGGFRIGKRAEVRLIQDSPYLVKAVHDGYGEGGHIRTFQMTDDGVEIKDEVTDDAVGYMHFAPDINIGEWDKNKIVTDLATIHFENITKIEMKKDQISREYNKTEESIMAKLYFTKCMSIEIKP